MYLEVLGTTQAGPQTDGLAERSQEHYTWGQVQDQSFWRLRHVSTYIVDRRSLSPVLGLLTDLGTGSTSSAGVPGV